MTMSAIDCWIIYNIWCMQYLLIYYLIIRCTTPRRIFFNSSLLDDDQLLDLDDDVWLLLCLGVLLG